MIRECESRVRRSSERARSALDAAGEDSDRSFRKMEGREPPPLGDEALKPLVTLSDWLHPFAAQIMRIRVAGEVSWCWC